MILLVIDNITNEVKSAHYTRRGAEMSKSFLEQEKCAYTSSFTCGNNYRIYEQVVTE